MRPNILGSIMQFSYKSIAYLLTFLFLGETISPLLGKRRYTLYHEFWLLIAFQSIEQMRKKLY